MMSAMARHKSAILRSVPYGGRRPVERKGYISDRRYKLARWQRVRLQVLARDGYRCQIVFGCTEDANVVDHIVPVHPGMDDVDFFGLHNLRAGCQRHNKARGFAPELDRLGAAPAKPSAVVSKDYT